MLQSWGRNLLAEILDEEAARLVCACGTCLPRRDVPVTTVTDPRGNVASTDQHIFLGST